MKYKATLEVEFSLEDMISEEDLKDFWNDDLLKFMQELYDSEGIGMFDDKIKLTNVSKGEEK